MSCRHCYQLAYLSQLESSGDRARTVRAMSGQGVCVGKLRYVRFVFVQNLHGKRVIED